MTIEKVFIDANTLLANSFRLAEQVRQDDFAPTHIIGIWRGGAPVGIAVQEFLEYHGHHADHIAVRTSSYEAIDQQAATVRVFSVSYLIKVLNSTDRLLLIDDVFDSGRSIAALIDKLQTRCRRNMPEQVKIATVYWKPSRNKTELKPDYYVEETEQWLVFPHELKGLTPEEIRANKVPAGLILGEEG